MRLPSSRLRVWRLESLALLAAYQAVALAQGNNNNNDDDDEDEDQPTPTQTRNSPRPTNDSNDDENDETTEEQQRRTSSKQETRETSTKTTESSSSTRSRTTSTRSDESPTSTVDQNYSYPPPAVPPTINAPFMDRSTMPDGTVFIVVGAILGAFGVALLVWRGIVACLLHRSVARAAAAQHIANEKSTHLPPGGAAAAAQKKSRRKSSPAGRGTRRTTRGPIPSHTPSQSNLFFSPTAAGSAAGGSNRDSRYLPSGFYAAGSSPAPPANYSSLRPDSRGQQPSRNTMRDVSPEGSPQYAARHADPSMSSLNLSQTPGQRAPSAYLDDLLDENPHMFPPPQMPAQAGRHHHSGSYSSQGRR